MHEAEKTSSSRRQHPTTRFVPPYVQPTSLSPWNQDVYFVTEARSLHCRGACVAVKSALSRDLCCHDVCIAVKSALSLSLFCREVCLAMRLVCHRTMRSFVFAENQGILFDVWASSYIGPRVWRSV